MPQPKNTSLYQKAHEIFVLSSNVSKYLVHDLAPLQQNGNENLYVYFTGDIIRQSGSLGLEIIKAENQQLKNDRINTAKGIASLTNRLYKNCERLEQSNSNGKEFVILLRKELRKFRRLQRSWMMTL